LPFLIVIAAPSDIVLRDATYHSFMKPTPLP